MATDRIVEFYSGGRDDRGRTLEQILAQPDSWLEAAHDYIQWVFPTPFRSSVNPAAPLVTPATAEAFAADPALRDRLRSAFLRILRFYGLRLADGRVDADPARFADRAGEWLQPHNHNHLRLTRIVQSLAALGLKPEAEALQQCLLGVAGGPGAARVARETVHYWREALR